jgi:protein-tyrosine phosphatase
MIKVLFVCLGNICRSPLAEAIFNQKVYQMGLQNQLSSDSAGTGAYHIGSDPDVRSIAVAKKHQTPIRHQARQITKKDGALFDYIIAMDDNNYRNITQILDQNYEGILLMRSFDIIETNSNVPDPYHGSIDDFEEVYQILDRSIENLISELRKNHQILK